MNQIIATTKFLSYFVNYLKPSNGISNDYLYVETSISIPISIPNQYSGALVCTQKLYLTIV